MAVQTVAAESIKAASTNSECAAIDLWVGNLQRQMYDHMTILDVRICCRGAQSICRDA